MSGIVIPGAFYATGKPRQQKRKLLHNDPGALSLLGANPFPDKPPRYIRAVLYRYEFVRSGNPAGDWWKREELGVWLQPLSADDPRLIDFLHEEGWLTNGAAGGEPGQGTGTR